MFEILEHLPCSSFAFVFIPKVQSYYRNSFTGKHINYIFKAFFLQSEILQV